MQLEVGLRRRVAKATERRGIQNVPAYISLQSVQSDSDFEYAVDLLEEIGIGHIELLKVGSTDRGEILIEIEVGPES
jgi:hypothetical protein